MGEGDGDVGEDDGGVGVSMGIRFPASENNLLIFREAINADFELNKNSDIELDDDILYLVEPDMLLNVFNTICQFKLFGYGFNQPKFYVEGKIESVISEKINNITNTVNEEADKAKSTLDVVHDTFNNLAESVNSFSIITKDFMNNFNIFNIVQSIFSLFTGRNKKNTTDDDFDL